MFSKNLINLSFMTLKKKKKRNSQYLSSRWGGFYTYLLHSVKSGEKKGGKEN